MICKRFEVTEDNEIKDYVKVLTISEVVNKGLKDEFLKWQKFLELVGYQK